ncbi:MAG: proton-conducting transporter membrane subunit [Nibricoccus sp.]
MMLQMLLPASALGLALSGVLGMKLPRLWLALVLASVAGVGAASVSVLLSGAVWEWRSVWAVGGETIHLRVDSISALFLLLLSIVGGAGAIYSSEYWSDRQYPTSAPRGRLWWSGLVTSMGAVLVTANGLHFLIAWELFTVCAFFLVTLDNGKREVRKAGWLYLVASHVGTMCLFAFFSTLAVKHGNWDLGPMRDEANLAPLFWLVLVGFGVKSGVFPLHVWLPSAHANAPSHVSGILSGVAIKLGVYGIVRFSGWLPLPAAAGPVVIGLGVISALLGIAFALSQNDIKRLLAYCSVENIGVIFIGFGLGLLGAAHNDAWWGRLALTGALLHVLNHGLFKTLLFFGAGSVLHAAGTREMSRLGGLWKRMPWTAGLVAFGAIAISGLPPLNGFVSEWLIYLGLFDAVNTRGSAAWMAMPAVIGLAVTGALALASFVKLCSIVFLGAPRTQAAERAHESGGMMSGPMLALASVCLTIGLAPVLFWPLVAGATKAWNPNWDGEGAAPPLLSTLSWVNAVLALAFVAAAVWLWKRISHEKGERRLTWDCGYFEPTSRMQYTGGSFAGIATGWFYWIIRPERRQRRPRGAFPESATYIEELPETVLDRVITPASSVILRVSTAVRRLQHGHLQSYILYLLVGLTAVAVLVLTGGPQ